MEINSIKYMEQNLSLINCLKKWKSLKLILKSYLILRFIQFLEKNYLVLIDDNSKIKKQMLSNE